MASLYDNSSREMTIEVGCPWYEAQQSFGAPNVNWCEETTCAYINEPANTWSNLGFILVGVFVIAKLNQLKENVVKHFAWAVIVMGALSFVYHATNNYLTQFFDFFGMYLMTSFVIAFGLQRVLGNDPRRLYSLFWFIVALNTGLFIVFDIADIAVQHTVAINVVFMLVFELWAGFKSKTLRHYLYFGLALGVMGAAQTVSQLDLKRVWCEPDNTLMHGHAIWHMLSALGMLLISIHLYKMLKLIPKKEP